MLGKDLITQESLSQGPRFHSSIVVRCKVLTNSTEYSCAGERCIFFQKLISSSTGLISRAVNVKNTVEGTRLELGASDGKEFGFVTFA